MGGLSGFVLPITFIIAGLLAQPAWQRWRKSSCQRPFPRWPATRGLLYTGDGPEPARFFRIMFPADVPHLHQAVRLVAAQHVKLLLQLCEHVHVRLFYNPVQGCQYDIPSPTVDGPAVNTADELTGCRLATGDFRDNVTV